MNSSDSALYSSAGTPAASINLNYSFDQRGGLTGLVDNAQNLTSGWNYDATSRLAGASLPNGWSRSYTYNALDQVLAVTQSNPAQGAMNFGHPTDPAQQLRYDGQGNMVRETANFGTGANATATGTTSYGYDGNDRLTGENSSRFSSYARSYTLDAAYNRISSTSVSGTAASISRTFAGNANNQVTGIATTQSGVTTNVGYTYDGEGNRASVTSGNTVTSYGYDSQQRLTAVTQSVGGAAATAVLKCGYRADGLRAWKENAQGRTYFLYDGSQLVGEFDSSGVMQVSQTWGAEGLAYRRTASGTSAGTRFYSWDVRGNVAATTDATGAVLNTPSSDGFSSSGGVEPCATFGGQIGGYRDSETGLVLFGQRYYDPGLGSWLTRDPIAENGGVNLYSYTQGNPVNGLDPSGLMVPHGRVPRPAPWDNLSLWQKGLRILSGHQPDGSRSRVRLGDGAMAGLLLGIPEEGMIQEGAEALAAREAAREAAQGAANAVVKQCPNPELAKFARSIGKNWESPTTKNVFEHLDGTVQDFVSKNRKAGIRAVLPNQYFNMTLRDALKQGKSTVTKMIFDRRWIK